MTVTLRGLGEQPGFYCYDADRPSWLPYWWDTWGESVCKFRSAPGNIAACLNPWSTSCASTAEPGSYVNARESAGLPVASPNRDPELSGPGMAAPGEPTNAPPEDPLSGYWWPAVLVVAGTFLVMALKK